MFNISAKIKLQELEYYLSSTAFSYKEIENTEIYSLVKELTARAKPSYKDKYDTKWEDFYLPVERRARGIVIPFSILKYKREFFISFLNMRVIHVRKGTKEAEKIFMDIFKEAIRFVKKKFEYKILEGMMPFDFRTGKIKGRYILNKVMSGAEAEEVLNLYKKHLDKGLKISRISLNSYLKTAGICYKASFGKKTNGLAPLEMYKKWADKRDGGMLSIKDWDSEEEFEKWYESGMWSGATLLRLFLAGINMVSIFILHPSFISIIT